jgi:radical SAM superfamily enzyme YgiQ (UPF0313 family)
MDQRKVFVFVDDNIVGNPQYAKQLFKALIPYKIKWLSQASVTIAKNEELLELAAASGCIDLLIGFETLSSANLNAVGKKINVIDEYETVIKTIHAHGIAIHGFFICGLDDDDETVFERTLRFAQEMRLESVNFTWPVPYPGTAFFECLDKAGRIITKDWAQYESNVVFKPQLMSPELLERWRYRILYDYYSLPSIWRRIGLAHRNLGSLWAVNLAYRRFSRRKLNGHIRQNYYGRR